MDYAIIAAGDGNRLLQEGITLSKPLIKVHGVTLIDRLINIFLKKKIDSLSIIINTKMIEVFDHLKSLQLPIPINIVVKTTPGSMCSFFELIPFFKSRKCCISTIDTIFKENIFSTFIQTFEKSDISVDGIMAVTDFINDEKPLYVAFNKKNFLIKKFSNHPISQYISGGIYCLTSRAIELLPFCIKRGEIHMRNYQHQLIKHKFKLQAFFLGKMIDIDHKNDIIMANLFL